MNARLDIVVPCRDEFLSTLRQLFGFAHGLFAVAMHGSHALRELANAKGDDDLQIRAGLTMLHEGPVTAGITFGKAFEEYNAHERWLFEMLHGRVVAKWHDFTIDVFRRALDSYLQGSLTSTAFTRLDLRLNVSAAMPLESAVLDGATRTFAFLDAQKRTEKIEGIAERKLSPLTRFLLKKHVVARNLAEHHDSIIRADDLKHIGLSELTMPDDWGLPKAFRERDRLPVGFWGVVEVLEVVARAAGELAGDTTTVDHFCSLRVSEGFIDLHERLSSEED